MSRTYKDSRGKGSKEPRRVTARGVKRRPIDYHKLSRALLDLAQAQAEADAAAATPKDREPTDERGSTKPEEAA